MINGARLRQAREAAGLTQVALAEALGVPQGVVSKTELGVREVSRADAIRIADALHVPVKFLFRDPITLPDGSLGLFRATVSKVKRTDYLSARRLAEIGAEAVLRLSNGAPVPMSRIVALSDTTPEEAAGHARSMLRLPADEPIDNLTFSLERAGAIVLRLSMDCEHIAGFSSWLDPVVGMSTTSRPLIVTRRPLGPFRLRFTLGHELGHLVLGHQVFAGPQRPEERDANLFAQALLMPREAALDDLSAARLDLERLSDLKAKWGLSMNAIAMRAKYLGVVDERAYRSIYEALRARGWLKVEPGDAKTPVEGPQLLRELAKRRKMNLSVYDLAGALDIGIDHARALLGEDELKTLTQA